MSDFDFVPFEPLDEARETVCPVCRLVYWTALGSCSNCELWEPSGLLQRRFRAYRTEARLLKRRIQAHHEGNLLQLVR